MFRYFRIMGLLRLNGHPGCGSFGRRCWWGVVVWVLVGALLGVGASVVGAQSSLGVPSGLVGEPAHVGVVRLDWDAVAGAVSYELRLGVGADWVVLPDGGVRVHLDGSAAFVAGLESEGAYWFSVRAVGEGDAVSGVV